jgi:hypothetical protein
LGKKIKPFAGVTDGGEIASVRETARYSISVYLFL